MIFPTVIFDAVNHLENKNHPAPFPFILLPSSQQFSPNSYWWKKKQKLGNSIMAMVCFNTSFVVVCMCIYSLWINWKVCLPAYLPVHSGGQWFWFSISEELVALVGLLLWLLLVTLPSGCHRCLVWPSPPQLFQSEDITPTARGRMPSFTAMSVTNTPF